MSASAVAVSARRAARSVQEPATEPAGIEVPTRREDLAVFAAHLPVLIPAAIVFFWAFGNLSGDAAARTANAFYTIFSADPHLGAIGFVWLPLPSLMQIPLLVVLRPLGLTLWAGPIETMIFASLSGVFLNRILTLHGFSRGWRWSLVALYGTNPFILALSVSGMTEVVFIAFLLMSMYFLMLWLRRSRFSYLAVSAIAALGALMTRFEALGFVAMTPLAITLVLVARRESRSYIEGHILAWMSIPVFGFMVFIFLSWLIVDNPLFFAFSEYATAGGAILGPFGIRGGLAGDAIAIKVDPNAPNLLEFLGQTLIFVGERIVRLAPAFLPLVAIVGVVALLRRSATTLAVVLLSVSVPLFTLFLQLRGQINGDVRYFVYGVPFALVIGGLVVRQLSSRPRLRRLAVGALVAFTLTSTISTVQLAFNLPSGPAAVLQGVAPMLRWKDPSFGAWMQSEVGEYLDARLRSRGAIVDAQFGFGIPIRMKRPEFLIVTSDRDFQDALEAVPDWLRFIVTNGAPDRVNRRLPTLYARGATGAKLVFEGDNGWRIYEILDHDAFRAHFSGVVPLGPTAPRAELEPG